jgi:SAM-dependent methyltransferase
MSPLTSRWKKKVFSEDPTLRPETRIRRQIDGIEKYLGLKYRARVLDLGCGAGSQTLELARRKFRVVGMDVSAAAFKAAREQAREDELTVHFMANDMRRIPFEGEFDAVINLRNPIGGYANERDDLRCLESIHKSLKRGGKVLLDLLNREWLIRRLGTPAKGEAKQQSFDLKTGRLDGRGFAPRGGSAKKSERLRIYSLTELIRLLSEAGFAFREVYGDYAGHPYSVESLRMLVAADRVAKAAPRRRPDDGYSQALRIKGRPG